MSCRDDLNVHVHATCQDPCDKNQHALLEERRPQPCFLPPSPHLVRGPASFLYKSDAVLCLKALSSVTAIGGMDRRELPRLQRALSAGGFLNCLTTSDARNTRTAQRPPSSLVQVTLMWSMSGADRNDMRPIQMAASRRAFYYRNSYYTEEGSSRISIDYRMGWCA